MRKILAILFTAFTIAVTTAQNVAAQCAMCKATVENNATAGDTALAESLNSGIIYLFAAPYLAIAIIGYFWYKSSKNNGSSRQKERHYQS